MSAQIIMGIFYAGAFTFAAFAWRRSCLVDRALDKHREYTRQHRLEGNHREGFERRQQFIDEAERANNAPIWRWTP